MFEEGGSRGSLCACRLPSEQVAVAVDPQGRPVSQPVSQTASAASYGQPIARALRGLSRNVGRLRTRRSSSSGRRPPSR